MYVCVCACAARRGELTLSLVIGAVALPEDSCQSHAAQRLYIYMCRRNPATHADATSRGSDDGHGRPLQRRLPSAIAASGYSEYSGFLGCTHGATLVAGPRTSGVLPPAFSASRSGRFWPAVGFFDGTGTATSCTCAELCGAVRCRVRVV